ncbi:MAG: hypothetical protein ACLR8Y_02505 [Alistipes indistinctus]
MAKITRGVQAILATQSPDGLYRGNYAPDAQLGGWDVWGRKYTMLGLLAYYRSRTGDKKSLEGAVKSCRPPADPNSRAEEYRSCRIVPGNAAQFGTRADGDAL